VSASAAGEEAFTPAQVRLGAEIFERGLRIHLEGEQARPLLLLYFN